MSTDLAYLAGFFDGEGSVYINRAKPNQSRGTAYHLEISFTNCDRQPLELAMQLFGGKLSSTNDSRPNSKPVYRVRIRSRKASAALAAMLPYLRVKRERADLAIRFQSGRVSGHITWSNDEMEDFRLAIQSQNDKVPNRAVMPRPESNVGDCVERAPRKAVA